MERTYELIRAVKHREIKGGMHYYCPAKDKIIFIGRIVNGATWSKKTVSFSHFYNDNELYEIEFKFKKQ